MHGKIAQLAIREEMYLEDLIDALDAAD